MRHDPLPVDQVLPDLCDQLSQSPIVILEAQPGAGKTTRVPPALLSEPWLEGQSIVMLEPRRLAARAAAARMASERGETPGGTIGYRIRFDSKISARTRVEVVTEGILTRRLQHDPELSGVGLLIFDEFHERSLHTDLALALALDVQSSLRPDLRILIMSATLDAEVISRFFGGAPIVRAEGRVFPVEVRYAERKQEPIYKAAARAALHAARMARGDVLVFLPGAGEIRQVRRILEEETANDSVALCDLYGDLPQREQDTAIQPDPRGRVKIILSTNIAETSLTIEGVRIVVDAGLARFLRFDPRTGLSRMETGRISKSSAVQRAGRAGRTGPGSCIRLYSEDEFKRFAEQIQPEILEADLAPFVLELALWGAKIENLKFLNVPPPAHVEKARVLLRDLGALDGSLHIHSLGRAMAALPVHPRLARMLVSVPENYRQTAADLAAVLSERDVLRPVGREIPSTDIHRRLDALSLYRDTREISDRSADRNAVIRAVRAADEIAVSAGRRGRALEQGSEKIPAPDSLWPEKVEASDAVGAMLALAYPDRIGSERRPGKYTLSSGRGAMLPDHDGLTGAPFLAVAEVDGSGLDGRIRTASRIGVETIRLLFADRIETRETAVLDEKSGRASIRRTETLGDCVLRSTEVQGADADEGSISQAILAAVRSAGVRSLGLSREADAFRTRVEFLRRHGESLPDFSDEALLAGLETWLLPYMSGITRISALTSLDFLQIFRSMLRREDQVLVDREAPTHLTVPSGSRIPLEYHGDSVSLSVKLQEMFGLSENPKVARGRVNVTIHLLSPAMRPVQVTQDLAGFWDRTYAEVRKELRGRYPRHPWPDDPRTALPTKYTKKRAGR